MTTSGQAPLKARVAAQTEAAGAGADASAAVRAPVAGNVSRVSYAPEAAITGAATDNRTVSVINRGQAGSGTTVVATLTFGNGVNAAAYDEKAITLSGTAANLAVAEGDILEFRSLHVGNGIADPGGLVTIEIDRD